MRTRVASMLPVAIALLALGTVRAAEPEKSAATVTATPPAQAPVKPLSPKQAEQRQLTCEERARANHIVTASRRAYIESCLRQIASANNY